MIPKGWKIYRIGDFIIINPKISLSKEGVYSFIEMKDLDSSRKYVTPSCKKNFKGGSKFCNGDTLFARITPCLENGKICQAKNLDNDAGFGSTEFIVLRGKEGISDSEFIYYLSRAEYIRNAAVQNMTGTSGRQRVETSAFAEIEIVTPTCLAEQSRIASILSSLDDKIELNLQMNKTLEAIAQAIFKEWFVDFRFPGFDGELVDGLPKGWSYVPIGSLFKTHSGGDWGKEEQSDEFPIRVAVIRGTDFNRVNSGDVSKVPIRFIKEINAEKKKIVNGDILLEISGGSTEQPTGRTILITGQILKLFDCPVVPASFCRLIRPLDFNHSLFLSIFFSRFYSLGGTWEYQNQSTGISNFQFRYFAEDKKLALPNNSFMISEFGKIVGPLIEKQIYNIVQITNLTEIRDMLLPKLMTGKIRVA